MQTTRPSIRWIRWAEKTRLQEHGIQIGLRQFHGLKMQSVIQWGWLPSETVGPWFFSCPKYGRNIVGIGMGRIGEISVE